MSFFMGMVASAGTVAPLGEYVRFSTTDISADMSPRAGNLAVVKAGGASARGARVTVGKSSGKWYWEVIASGNSWVNSYPIAAISKDTISLESFPTTADSYIYEGINGRLYHNNTNVAYGSAYGVGVVIGIALDLDNGELTFYRNNVSQGTITGVSAGTWFPTVWALDPGSRAVLRLSAESQTYAPPVGFSSYSPNITPVGVGAHRYWRLLIDAPDGSTDYCGFTELILRDVGGRDLSTCINPTTPFVASSIINASNSGNRAFDGNLVNSGWLSATASPSSISIDFGNIAMPGPVEVTSFDIYGSHNAPNASPRDFRLQYSDDNVNWTDARVVLGEMGWTATQLRTFPVSFVSADTGAHRYWRARPTELNGTTSTSAAELELRAVPGGPSIATGGVAIASSEFNGSTVAANAFDGNPSTIWAAIAGTGLSSFIGYDFGVNVEILEVAYTCRNDALPEQAWRDFQIQYSDDGTSWSTSWTVEEQTGWSLGETRVFTRP